MLIDVDDNVIDSISEQYIIWGHSKRNIEFITQLNIGDKILFCADDNAQIDEGEQALYSIKSKCETSNYPEATIISVLSKETVMNDISEYPNADVVFFTPDDSRNLLGLKASNKATIEQNKRYEYLHFINDDKFLVPLYHMFERYLDIEQHLFIMSKSSFVNDGGTYKIATEKKNILVIGQGYTDGLEEDLNGIIGSDFLKSNLDYCKKIILHSGYVSKCVGDIAPEYGHKMEWIAWGGDLFFDSSSYFVADILKYVRCGWLSGEKNAENIRETYGIEARTCEIRYGYIDEDLKLCTKDDGVFRILLGHSGDLLANASYGMKILERFKDENIEIYAPLSYGDKGYIDIISYIGTKVFGEKFIPILNHIEMTEYYEILSYMNVALFPCVRIKGVTTATYLNAIGREVYYLPDVLEIGREKGLKMLNIDDINNMTFEEFRSLHPLNLCGLDGIRKNNEKIINEWIRILNA